MKPTLAIRSFKDGLTTFLQEHCKRPTVCKSAPLGVVYWFIEHEGWTRPCWVKVWDRGRGRFQVSNTVSVQIPRKHWPLEMPDCGGIKELNRNVSANELTPALFEEIYQHSLPT